MMVENNPNSRFWWRYGVFAIQFVALCTRILLDNISHLPEEETPTNGAEVSNEWEQPIHPHKYNERQDQMIQRDDFTWQKILLMIPYIEHRDTSPCRTTYSPVGHDESRSWWNLHVVLLVYHKKNIWSLFIIAMSYNYRQGGTSPPNPARAPTTCSDARINSCGMLRVC